MPIHVYPRLCMHICDVSVYVYICLCVSVRAYISLSMSIYAYTYQYTCGDICLHVSVYACMLI